jgi:hypothetical protein
MKELEMQVEMNILRRYYWPPMAPSLPQYHSQVVVSPRRGPIGDQWWWW